MARKNKSALASAFVPESIVDPVIDHSSQISSWAVSETAEEPLRASKEEWEQALENVSRKRGAESDPNDEFGAVLEDEALLEVIEAQAEANETAEVSAPPAAVDPNAWADRIESFDEDTVVEKAKAISAAIDDRSAFELATNPDNGNIHKTLKKVHGAFFTKAAARVMLATNTSEDFINRSVHEGKRYNVYALGKIADLMKAATDGVMANAINIACMKSLFAMQGAGKPFTLEVAKACASKQYGCDAAIRQHLVRHTVAPITAPTQASSTMQAMVTLGIVTSSGSAKNPVYALTTNPIVDRMRDVLKAA